MNMFLQYFSYLKYMYKCILMVRMILLNDATIFLGTFAHIEKHSIITCVFEYF
jgi:hypothetical protein